MIVKGVVGKGPGLETRAVRAHGDYRLNTAKDAYHTGLHAAQSS